MSKFRIAVSGGGIASLCLALALHQLDPNSDHVQIDVYESSPEFIQVGAGITLWGRVCEALHFLKIDQECIDASVVAASTNDPPVSPDAGFTLREAKEPHKPYGKLPFRDAWSLHRADLLQILLKRVPPNSTHLGKRFVRYEYTSSDPDASILVHFADGSTTECDVLLGADGLRSAVRGQMMREAEDDPNKERDFSYEKHIHPRFTGTITYRALIPSATLAARNPDHPLLQYGQIYLGKHKHLVGYPISSTTINLAINVTATGCLYDSSNTPSSTDTAVERARILDSEAFVLEAIPKFEGWTGQPADVLQSVESAIEWPVMDLEPLPFYSRRRIAVFGDAAHAAVPFLGAGAAFAIEDAFVLSRLLYAAATFPTSSVATPSSTLELALLAFDNTRRPYGNRLIMNGRRALCEYELMGPSGDDTSNAVATIVEISEESARVGEAGPCADIESAIQWLQSQCNTEL